MKLALAAVFMMFAQSDGNVMNGTKIQIPRVTPEGGLSVTTPPRPVWVPDPSAGHYDCPKGWTAYERTEPIIPPTHSNAVYVTLPKDAKGHILQNRPSPGICITE